MCDKIVKSFAENLDRLIFNQLLGIEEPKKPENPKFKYDGGTLQFRDGKWQHWGGVGSHGAWGGEYTSEQLREKIDHDIQKLLDLKHEIGD